MRRTLLAPKNSQSGQRKYCGASVSKTSISKASTAMVVNLQESTDEALQMHAPLSESKFDKNKQRNARGRD